MTRPVLRLRRKEARKIAKLARAFAALDDQARLVRARAQARRATVARHLGRTKSRPHDIGLRPCRGTTQSPSATTRSRTRRAPRRSCCSGTTSASARRPACSTWPAARAARPCSSPRRSAAASTASSARPSSSRRRTGASRRQGSGISSRSSRRTRTRFRSSPRPGTLRSASVRPSSGTTSAGRSRRLRRRCGPAATSSSASRTGASGRCRAASTTRAGSRCARRSRRFESAGLALEGLIASSEQDWDHYESQHWRALEEWLAANPRDPDAPDIRERHEQARDDYLSFQRELLGWAIFVARKPY